MEKILITGGAGYIGTHCTLELLKQGKKVVAVDNLSNSNPKYINSLIKMYPEQLDFFHADISNESVLSSIFESRTISSVIHLAADKSVPKSIDNPMDFYKNNISSTLCLLNLVKKYGINKFVFSSSATVYSDKNDMPLDEEFSYIQPSNPYGRSKFFVEQILQDYAHSSKGISIGILRYFNPMGADQSGFIGEDPIIEGGNLAPELIKASRSKSKEFQIYGKDYDTRDGTCIRDFIHISDLADGHIKALSYLESNNGFHIWNLGSEKGFSVYEVVQTFQQISGVKLDIRYNSRRQGDIAVSLASAKKAQRQLGWKAEKKLSTMLIDMYNFSTQNHSNGK